jgi:uncharacterized OB-fold protein
LKTSRLVKRFTENKEKMHMDERTSCPLCRYENPPANRFCSHCGASLTSKGQLTPRPEAKSAAVIRFLPTKISPASKALAVGLAVLATEAGLAWLRRRVEYDDRLSPLATRTPKSAGFEHITGQSVEEVFVWLQKEGKLQGRGFARRVVWTSDTTIQE